MCNSPKTQDRTFKFEGIPSGDMESFCWDVDKETYVRIKGKEPGKFDKSVSHKDMYKIYPDDFYGFDKPKCKMTINIEVIKN